jgi:low affinity Fe/Cu permease
MFSRIATKAASGVGSGRSFAAAMAAILLWAALGPHYHYSDTWQLVMNSFTDIFTFLIVFLIQHTQKRDSKAINLKLDEIIRAVHGAEDELIDIEKCSDEELENLERRYEEIRTQVRMRRERGEAA